VSSGTLARSGTGGSDTQPVAASATRPRISTVTGAALAPLTGDVRARAIIVGDRSVATSPAGLAHTAAHASDAVENVDDADELENQQNEKHDADNAQCTATGG